MVTRKAHKFEVGHSMRINDKATKILNVSAGVTNIQFTLDIGYTIFLLHDDVVEVGVEFHPYSKQLK
jgi:hypothetical protein